jgi:preprotein translocase subunit SecD
MAPAPPSRPRRLLVGLTLVVVTFGLIAFWPGTDSEIRLGLDLRGGTEVTLLPKPVTAGTEITQELLDQTVSIIRQRVDGLGVAEAEVTTQGTGNSAAIVVSVPGENPDRLVDLVQRTALLDFRPVFALGSPAPGTEPTAEASPGASPTAETEGQQTGTIVQASENDEAFQNAVNALDCTDPAVYAGGTPDDPTLWLGTCDRTGAAKYVLEPAFIQGSNVTGANANLQQQGLGWVVSLNFDSEGARALSSASSTLSALPDCGQGQSPCNAFAIVLDGVVVSAPRFNEPIPGGSAEIQGSFTAQEANDLANVLKYGALPVTLELADVTTISPTVGNDQLRAGIIAGLIGLALVALYLLIYYRALGVVAVVSLLVAGSLTYLIFVSLSKTIGLTLTLAGVAGAIVAIGITADSFIVYFERIRDEIREGRSLRQACDSGWVRARRTLLAADFVSLLAATVLYFLSVGSVRGFAFVLGLTTVVDVLVAFWFTHPVVVLLGRSSWMQKGSKWSGLNAERLGGHALSGGAATRSRRRGAATETTADDPEEVSAP